MSSRSLHAKALLGCNWTRWFELQRCYVIRRFVSGFLVPACGLLPAFWCVFSMMRVPLAACDRVTGYPVVSN
jgi:hypothetical protein